MTTAQRTQFSNTKFFPLTYVLKYEPPMIGMVYKLNENDQKKRIYKIYLHGLIYNKDPDQITRQLFLEHALHINENNVSHKQIKSLVSKLLQSRGKKNESSPGLKKDMFAKQPGAGGHVTDLLGLDPPKGNQAKPNIKDFGQRPAMNKFQYGQDEEEEEEDEDERQFEGEEEGQEYDERDLENDHLEFDGEGEDIEHGENVFAYNQYAQKQQQKPQHTTKPTNMDFLGGNNKKSKDEDEMDFILDDADNLENLSDY